jgi:hypothetical protein
MYPFFFLGPAFWATRLRSKKIDDVRLVHSLYKAKETRFRLDYSFVQFNLLD